MSETMSHYRILSPLGEGGMGKVYLAEDIRLQRTVALKVLPTEVASNRELRARFLTEARAASALNHPNVATVYEIGEAGGIPFIAMEYVEGQTLAAKIHGQPLAVAELVDIGIQGANALAEAHAKGITHRDIKPGNIMVTPRGHVKVLDFGLAKRRKPTGESVTAHTSPGLVMGTAKYMSPEQALGSDVDHRSDIFSFGAVLYEMATGRAPFGGENDTQMLLNTVHAEPDAITRFNYNVPPELERIVRKCMEKDRERRYQSAPDLEVDLRNFKRDAGGPVAAAASAPPAPATAPPAPGSRSRLVPAAAAVLAVLAIAVSAYFWLGGTAKGIDSLAVLPLANQAGDPDIDYLSDGITETLINSLSRLNTFKVMSRSAVFRYKGKAADPGKVGRDLGVRAVLTGRMLQRSDNLIVSVELVDTRDNRQIWGERYDRPAQEVMALQHEIAGAIAEQLDSDVTQDEMRTMAEHAPGNSEAYDLYMKGRYHLEKYTHEDWKIGMDLMDQATVKDPSYALAYAGLADSYVEALDWFLPANIALPRMKTAARKAIDLNKNLPEAHVWLAMALVWGEWDWAGAEREFKHSLELDPKQARPRAWYGYYLAAAGRLEEARKQADVALALDPKSAEINLLAGIPYFFSRDFSHAADIFQKAIELDPGQWWAHLWLGRTSTQQGRLDEALKHLEAARKIEDITEVRAALGYVQARSGNRVAARNTFSSLADLGRKRFVPAGDMSVILTGLDEKDQALDWLARACEERSDLPIWMAVDPWMDTLRTEPRFQELLRKVTGAAQP